MQPPAIIGVDLAKNVFQLHGVNADGAVVLKKRLRRLDLVAFFAEIPPCLVAMEACSSAHHWARTFVAIGHEVRILPISAVKQFAGRHKNDAIDAKAICRAAQYTDYHPVPIKAETQQGALALHATRELLMRQRIALGNALRAVCAEFGVTLPVGVSKTKSCAQRVRDGMDVGVPADAVPALEILARNYIALSEQIDEIEKVFHAQVSKDERCTRLMTIPGVGPITAAAIVAVCPDMERFATARRFAGWVGLVPKQDASAERLRFGGITRMGTGYLRKLLFTAAQSKMRAGALDPDNAWVRRLRSEKSWRVASVAVANKMSRTVWAIMTSGEQYAMPKARLTAS